MVHYSFELKLLSNKDTTINIIYMIKRKVIIPVIKWIQKV
ncbi:hypothetical protein HMPREF0545_1799 [Ligilactobacillus salivarius DSM 20555 = ATCC 11741]|uniref:Uncharacterized protein n=1 Tax=Ligilactobacillus salivarius DSM 20555 = ATCC 11741 TaxID=1423799 RepID=C2EJH7_9LACO|nr:hypothetical protein HMPREF0545_1799 [Ligilactobacillus salivarius DSM 20555 = ATCC 11741]